MMFNLVPAILGLPNETLTVTRRAAGTIGTDGFYNAGVESSLTVKGTIYNPQPKELQRLEEGSRNKEVIGIISQTELRTGEPNSYQCDIVTRNSKKYEVQKVSDYSNIGNFYSHLAVLVQE